VTGLRENLLEKASLTPNSCRPIAIDCGNLHYYLAILQLPIAAWKKLSYHYPPNYSTSPT
jgi:hypothetical protein